MTSQQLDAEFIGRLRTAIAAQMPQFLPNQRWFRSKARAIQSVQLSDAIPIPLSESLAFIVLIDVEFTEGQDETYVLPLVAPAAGRAVPRESVVLRLSASGYTSEQPLIDALTDREFLVAILNAIVSSRSFPGDEGFLLAAPESMLSRQAGADTSSLEPRVLKGEQSNSSVKYGDRLILKIFRRVEEGIHPDLEIGRFLTSVAHFSNTPPLCGSLTYESHDSKVMTLGVLQQFVPNIGDGWRCTVESLAALFASPDHPTEEPKLVSGVAEVSARFGRHLDLIGLLGKRTAELHLALASSGDDPGFAPERFTTEIRVEMDRAFHDMAVQNFGTLRAKLAEMPAPVAELAGQALRLEDDALLVLHSIAEKDFSSIRTRIHGDYHLGQVLFTGSDYFIIDFEGEPAHPLSDRRNKRSPLQDIAGMLRSFHYAARTASISTKERLPNSGNLPRQIDSLAAEWQDSASREFLSAYRRAAGDAKFLPAQPEFDALLKIYLVEKAVYEMGYELNNRPAWLPIPLEGIRGILAARHNQ